MDRMIGTFPDGIKHKSYVITLFNALKLSICKRKSNGNMSKLHMVAVQAPIQNAKLRKPADSITLN